MKRTCTAKAARATARLLREYRSTRSPALTERHSRRWSPVYALVAFHAAMLSLLAGLTLGVAPAMIPRVVQAYADVVPETLVTVGVLGLLVLLHLALWYVHSDDLTSCNQSVE